MVLSDRRLGGVVDVISAMGAFVLHGLELLFEARADALGVGHSDCSVEAFKFVLWAGLVFGLAVVVGVYAGAGGHATEFGVAAGFDDDVDGEAGLGLGLGRAFLGVASHHAWPCAADWFCRVLGDRRGVVLDGGNLADVPLITGRWVTAD